MLDYTFLEVILLLFQLNWDEIKKAMQSVENNPTTEEYKLN